MVNTDLCFERSEVQASVTSYVESIKNPLSGIIRVPEVGKIIMDIPEAKGKILIDSDFCNKENKSREVKMVQNVKLNNGFP